MHMGTSIAVLVKPKAEELPKEEKPDEAVVPLIVIDLDPEKEPSDALPAPVVPPAVLPGSSASR